MTFGVKFQSFVMLTFVEYVETVLNYISLGYVGNPGLLRSHAQDCVGCMKIYPRLSKSIAMEKQIFKNNMNTIENIDLENKTTYL